ncbi:hypothetical protein Golax_010299 [Gossypium laxum]|uniref:Uncharacterized protein n=1 Tax=Gossypium laxum TaxID=34288 RepID=A0A7J8ZGU0_9ROSI|nr:hypothetical protein [Gossypium laxum]
MLVSKSNEFGMFILIRLMSSGKIEAQRYYASWDLVQNFDVAHREPLFKYLNLDYLYGYLNNNLAEGLGSRSSPALSIAFNNISLPTSICKVASRQMWATLPLELLLLAFSSYLELLDVPFDDMTMPLEFSVVLNLPQSPLFLLRKPSCHNTKWSSKMQPDGFLMGLILPLPILVTLHEFHNSCLDSEKMCGFSLDVEFGFRPKQFLLYHASVGEAHGNCIYNDVKFTTKVTKVHKVIDPNDTMDSVELELLDALCPVEFEFDVPIMNFVLMEKWVSY